MVTLTNELLDHCNAEYHFNGKDLRGVVAAAIYLTGRKYGFSISQKKIAQITGVTDVTIRARARELGNIV